MQKNSIINYLKEVIDKMPNDWLQLTTHRLDIYNEELAKTQFIQLFETLYEDRNAEQSALNILPTAYDYIRLGHPLSCVLEWSIGKFSGVDPDAVISFSSKITPLLAILRANKFAGISTRIVHADPLPEAFDAAVVRDVYSYAFETIHAKSMKDLSVYDGCTVFVSSDDGATFQYSVEDTGAVDYQVALHGHLGSVLIARSDRSKQSIADIQHVRRRETIAMTPAHTLMALRSIVNNEPYAEVDPSCRKHQDTVITLVDRVTGAHTDALIGSSGLSIQYAIMMGLIHDSIERHPDKPIKIVVPPNCYGGTNDQARRVAACIDKVEVVDLPVDGNNDMVRSVDQVLTKIAAEDAVPLIIAEIPTNPRVEVPDLQKLAEALSAERRTPDGAAAVSPVFILDQTFCPNVRFVEADSILSSVRTISYASGSKFPSGGRCTAGYCVGNEPAKALMKKVAQHLRLCDNEATDHQIRILAQQMPSMLQRISDAYENTRDFVSYIEEVLPGAKINFVSEALAKEGFTPSVFSLDLPTKGESEEVREAYKREMNHQLINMMITEIPTESKYCVSYGQLKGCYWTIPATSTQGTTKEGDKDYIARVSLSGNMDMEKHKAVFLDFVQSL